MVLLVAFQIVCRLIVFPLWKLTWGVHVGYYLKLIIKNTLIYPLNWLNRILE
uniref:TLC domain-containing protein n=1 Tax=Anguilla anguilla TaxID=7936 RepID=A0A0E9QPW8_ANGAN